MTEFDPGDGWREVSSDATGDPLLVLHRVGETSRVWVREDPVPPLPTEPYTVIRVTWKDDEDDTLSELLVRGDEQWSAVEAEMWHSAEHLAERMTGFEVLAEPIRRVSGESYSEHWDKVRRETAKAIRDEVQKRATSGTWNATLIKVVREFGVTE